MHEHFDLSIRRVAAIGLALLLSTLLHGCHRRVRDEAVPVVQTPPPGRIEPVVAPEQAAAPVNAPPPKTVAPGLRIDEVPSAQVPASPTARGVSSPGVRFEEPVAFPDNALPAYPPGLLPARLPTVSIKVRLDVNAKGTIEAVRGPADLPARHRPFFDSILAALMRWQFVPLVQMEPAPGRTPIEVGGFTTFYPGKATALPFHQDHVFVFRQVDGRPVVESR